VVRFLSDGVDLPEDDAVHEQLVCRLQEDDLVGDDARGLRADRKAVVHSENN
jgi:hypothetical protein